MTPLGALLVLSWMMWSVGCLIAWRLVQIIKAGESADEKVVLQSFIMQCINNQTSWLVITGACPNLLLRSLSSLVGRVQVKCSWVVR